MSDTELLDYLGSQDGAALVSDDNGRWAVTMDGVQSLPGDEPNDMELTFIVEAHQWRHSICEAILAFKAEQESPR